LLKPSQSFGSRSSLITISHKAIEIRVHHSMLLKNLTKEDHMRHCESASSNYMSQMTIVMTRQYVMSYTWQAMVVHAWTHLTWSNVIHAFARSPLGYICHQINTTYKPKYNRTCFSFQFQDVVNIPMSPGHTTKITYYIVKKRWRLRKTIFLLPNINIYRNQCSQ
jgi:hypothetical protein